MVRRVPSAVAWAVASAVMALALPAVSVVVGPATPVSASTSFTLAGGGFGHGVGLSQYGAKGRADQGHTAEQIVAAYYPGTTLEARPVSGPSVRLADTASTELTVSGGSLSGGTQGGATSVLAGPGERVALRMSGTSLVAQRVYPSAGPTVTLSVGGARARLTWSSGSTVLVGATARSYAHGFLTVIPKSSTMRIVIDGMSMQQYLYGLAEMPTSWNLQALRSQAIAGRSYAAYRVGRPQSSEFDMYASIYDQVYSGTASLNSSHGANWRAAVDSTDQLVVVWNGSIVQTFYSSSNGGYTERSDYVWSATLPYLIAAPDPFDSVAANSLHTWTRTYSGAELGAWIADAGRGRVGTVTRIVIGGNVGASGRNEKALVTVTGTAATVALSGAQFRAAINAGAASSRDLLSTKFHVQGSPIGPGPTSPGPDPSGPTPTTAPRPRTDTRSPQLAVIAAPVMRFGSSGKVCAFVTSDETAIYRLHLKVGSTVALGSVGGVGPKNPQISCISLPASLRSSGERTGVLTGAALDAGENFAFDVKNVRIGR